MWWWGILKEKSKNPKVLSVSRPLLWRVELHSPNSLVLASPHASQGKKERRWGCGYGEMGILTSVLPPNVRWRGGSYGLFAF